ncbi:MAG: hypothetical protein EOP06_11350, partial [Proteobacteria bacterium]
MSKLKAISDYSDDEIATASAYSPAVANYLKFSFDLSDPAAAEDFYRQRTTAWLEAALATILNTTSS